MSAIKTKSTPKAGDTTPSTAQRPSPIVARRPSLIAYYAMPVPKGQQPALVPIGGAVEHADGESFTLQLHLMPPIGAHIILRKPKVAKTA